MVHVSTNRRTGTSRHQYTTAFIKVCKTRLRFKIMTIILNDVRYEIPF